MLFCLRGRPPVISHRAIAERANVKRLSVQKIITDKIADFEELGAVRFKIEPRNDGAIGGDKPKTYYLNEQQAYLLFTYLRNTKVVRQFKKALVKEFFAMRDYLKNAIPNQVEDDYFSGDRKQLDQQEASLDMYYDAQRLYYELDQL